MGLTKEEIEQKKPEIIEFADIGDHLYQPVKTYSSGMFARLAFACAINVNPDVLIVDEVLSVILQSDYSNIIGGGEEWDAGVTF